jgi:hypothetical protein
VILAGLNLVEWMRVDESGWRAQLSRRFAARSEPA